MIKALFDIPNHIPRKRRRYFSIANVAGMGGFAGHLVLLLGFYYYDVTPMVWFNMGSIILFIAVFALNRVKDFATIGIYLAVSEIVVHAITAVLLVGWEAGFYSYLFLVFIIVFMVRKKYDKLGLFVSIANLLILIALLAYCREYPEHPIMLSDKATYFFSIFNLTCAAGLLGAGVYYYKITANYVEDELETLYGRVTDSIRYAHRIQRVLLPENNYLSHHTDEHFIYYKPRDIVSGDFYWTRYFPEQEQLIVAVLDCTGHGVPGAFMTMMASVLLESAVVDRGIRLPDQILEELHKNIVRLLKQNSSDRQEGMDIAICSIDFAEREVCYSGAKRPLLMVQEDQLHEIKGTRRSVGGQWKGKKDPPSFELHCFPIDEKPISIYMFTDGFTDQFGGGEDQKFTMRRFREMIGGIQHLSMQSQRDFLSDTFNDWAKGSTKQLDDVLVVGIKVPVAPSSRRAHKVRQSPKVSERMKQ